jgi:hypothetical protein
MRQQLPIPGSRLPAVLAVGVAVVSIGALLLLLADEVVGP